MSQLQDVPWKSKLGKWWRRLKTPAVIGDPQASSLLSHDWGFNRGTPIDRYYIERFLDENRSAITGHVLELLSPGYAKKYGIAVTKVDVLDTEASNTEATIITNLESAHSIPSQSFDCIILTQTMQYVFDMRAAVGHCYRILRSGGVLLATVPSVSRLDPDDARDSWRFMPEGCVRLFSEHFGLDNTTVAAHGNLATCIAFLRGAALEELPKAVLDTTEDAFPLIVTIRAVRP